MRGFRRPMQHQMAIGWGRGLGTGGSRRTRCRPVGGNDSKPYPGGYGSLDGSDSLIRSQRDLAMTYP